MHKRLADLALVDIISGMFYVLGGWALFPLSFYLWAGIPLSAVWVFGAIGVVCLAIGIIIQFVERRP